MLEKLKIRLCLIYKVCSAACLVAMVLINIIQVLCRYFVSISFIWAEDISIYLLHWIVAFSMPLLWLLKEHMVMDVANSILPKKVLNFLDLLIDSFGFVFGFVFAHKALVSTLVNKGYVMSIAGYDEMWKYVPYVIGGTLMAFSALINLVERFSGKKNEKEVSA